LCIYAATVKKSFNDGKPLDVAADDVGHTWVSKEDCDAPNDEIVTLAYVYSFGPYDSINTKFRRKQFANGSLKGASWPIDHYLDDTTFVVVKKCWELTQEQCENLAKDIRNPQYPLYYTPEIHCTTEAIKFAAGHGASNIPSANGQVKYNGNSETRPNPKALAENMAKNGGMPAKIPPENNQ
jgi:hypothetical protein